jgi:hypothetical protein
MLIDVSEKEGRATFLATIVACEINIAIAESTITIAVSRALIGTCSLLH